MWDLRDFHRKIIFSIAVRGHIESLILLNLFRLSTLALATLEITKISHVCVVNEKNGVLLKMHRLYSFNIYYVIFFALIIQLDVKRILLIVKVSINQSDLIKNYSVFYDVCRRRLGSFLRLAFDGPLNYKKSCLSVFRPGARFRGLVKTFSKEYWVRLKRPAFKRQLRILRMRVFTLFCLCFMIFFLFNFFWFGKLVSGG